MSTRVATVLIIVLAIVIVVLAWFLWTTPASAPTTDSFQTATTSQAAHPTIPATSASQPLDASVVVTSPTPNATVAQTFIIAGNAPGAWFDEAVFPIQVRDADDNLVGTAQGHAQGEWTTTGPVTFTATMTINANFHGSANLILLKDNESGLPQNDDSVTIPITVQ